MYFGFFCDVFPIVLLMRFCDSCMVVKFQKLYEVNAVCGVLQLESLNGCAKLMLHVVPFIVHKHHSISVL